MKFILHKLRDYVQFFKLRLTMLVVFSAVAGFLMGVGMEDLDLEKLLLLVIAGLMVTGSSNGLNQILERHLDKMMSRTSNRPLPAGRMNLPEAYVLATLLGSAGLYILFVKMNLESGFLGLFALLTYAFVYTPLKRETPFAVLVGAFPGAIPPLLGWVAATGNFEIGGLILFAIQFIWQFPHFWAIAWVLDEDYQKAGFKLLPSQGGRDKGTAFQVLVYSICLIPISLLPIAFNMAGHWAGMVIFATGCLFLMYSFKLYKTREHQASKKLMFASFAYLPIIQLALIIDKI